MTTVFLRVVLQVGLIIVALSCHVQPPTIQLYHSCFMQSTQEQRKHTKVQKKDTAGGEANRVQMGKECYRIFRYIAERTVCLCNNVIGRREGMKYSRIRELRDVAGISQKKLAEMLGCSRQNYGRYERGEQAIPGKMLISLSRYYSVSADYILGRTTKR